MLDCNIEQFESAALGRIVFGPGCLDRLGELAMQCGGRRVLVVTDPGVAEAGHVARAVARIEAAGAAVSVFDGVVENPTTSVVERCAAQARREQVDLLVGLGGGSSLDAAKGCNFVLTGGGRMEDYWGVGKAAGPMLPMIAVPTTAGTGSECQSFALITHPTTHVKMACGDAKALPKVALLDPLLTLTQPRWVTAATAIDAVAHAVESAVTRKRNAVSQIFSREAFRLCSGALPRVLAVPEDVDARGAMLLGAALAGVAIENSMLGAAHAAANPLTARYGIVHGCAVGLMVPGVVRHNAADPHARQIYAELARIAGVVGETDGKDADDQWAAAALATLLQLYLDAAGLPRSLADLNVPEAAHAELAAEAARQWTAQFNPRAVTAADFLALYRSVSGATPAETLTSGSNHDVAS